MRKKPSRLWAYRNRKRIIAKRRRNLSIWMGSRGTVSREEREKSYWTAERLGKLAKWNGNCNCILCKGHKRKGWAKLGGRRRPEVATLDREALV